VGKGRSGENEKRSKQRTGEKLLHHKLLSLLGWIESCSGSRLPGFLKRNGEQFPEKSRPLASLPPARERNSIIPTNTKQAQTGLLSCPATSLGGGNPSLPVSATH
jgi:hypothetical protein